jgi:hypothetical protein
VGYLFALGSCASVLPDQNPLDGYVWVNPGAKLAYTFGEGGGLTYGFEVSTVIANGSKASTVLGVGPVLNLTWTSKGTFNGRLGGQIVSWLWGVEAGPALVTDRRGTHFGFGVTPWVGAIVVPYWTYTLVAGSSSLNEWGVYGKLPICTGSNCDYSGGGDGGDD